MAGVPPIDRDGRARARPPRARRTGWFSRPADLGPMPDQEAEIRARLYAKPEPAQRTVQLIERVERLADRPAA